MHKISLREVVCTKRVCDAVLSLLSTLIDFGLLANRNSRDSVKQKDKESKAKNEGPSNERRPSTISISAPTTGATKAETEEKKESASDPVGGIGVGVTAEDGILSVHNTFMDVVVRYEQHRDC